MAGGNPQKPSSSHHRKSQPDSTTTINTNPSKPPSSSNPPPPPPNSKPKPSPKPNPNSVPSPSPRPRPPPPPPQHLPPPPAYGFHMLDRRTIVLADGTARSYFALPPDYQDFPRAPIRPPDPWLGFDRQILPGGDRHRDRYQQQNQEHWNSVGFEGFRKRKFGDERDDVNDEFARQRQKLLQYGNMISNGAGTSNREEEVRVGKQVRPEGGLGSLLGRFSEADQGKFKSSFLNYVRVLNENANQKKRYLADGKQGSVQCLACGRSSKDFPDVHSLVMHTYNSEKETPDQVPDHLGLHKALCLLMGWNYLMPPDNSKVYQRLSAEEIASERNDLIMWPPHVIVRNTTTGKSKDGRMEGLGNKAMDMKLRDIGFTTGKPKSMYSRDGHMGTTVVKFSGDQSGLKDAMGLADFFEKQMRGRGSWASVQHMFRPGNEDEKDPNFVKLDKNGQKERILYAYLGTVSDLEILDFDTRKKVTIESKREKLHHT